MDADIIVCQTQMLEAVTGLIVVATSRQLWPCHSSTIEPHSMKQHSVGSVPSEALSGLVNTLVGGEGSGVISASEVTELVAACKGVPLTTRLTADAIAHGRLTMQVGRNRQTVLQLNSMSCFGAVNANLACLLPQACPFQVNQIHRLGGCMHLCRSGRL